MRLLVPFVIAVLLWPALALSASPDSGDLQVIESLKKHGSDVSRPHPIDFYLYFPSESAARRACSSLTSGGFTALRVSQLDASSPWLCLVQKTLVPTDEALTEIRSRLTAIASKLGGEYDGWEAPILKSE